MNNKRLNNKRLVKNIIMWCYYKRQFKGHFEKVSDYKFHFEYVL